MPKMLVLTLLILWPAWGPALESSGQFKEKNTSELREFSTNPLKIYSARGRRDPFLLPMMLPPQEDLKDVALADLFFSGIFAVGSRQVAMFRKTTGREVTLTLRGGYLFGLENNKLSGIKGKILNSYTVVLKKGEESFTYTVNKEKDSPLK